MQEQVAGDVLFPDDPEGIVALGFIAAGPWDFIGHVEVPETKIDGKVARDLDRDNMVSNTFNTFCSVTVQCARCHNHKFDPFTQEHYFGLQAVFSALDRADRSFDSDPEVAAQRRSAERRLEHLLAEQKELNREIEEAGGPPLAELNRELEELSRATVTKDPEFGYHAEIAPIPDTEKWVAVDFTEFVTISRVVLRPCHDDFAGIGSGFGFPVRFRVEMETGPDEWTIALDHSVEDYENPGLSPVVVDALDAAVRRIRIVATRLSERAGDYIFALAELQALDADGENLARSARVTSADSIEAPIRWGRVNLTDGKWPSIGDLSQQERLEVVRSERAKILAAIETPHRVNRRDAIERSVADVRQALQALPEPKTVYAATTHFDPQANFKPTRGVPRPVHVLHRGDVRQPRARAVPGALPLGRSFPWQFEANSPEGERRVALARWLTHPEHPLVWRSIVNRIWQHHFGRGLVATPNDFGRMGEKPTHPELLDWLAREFRESGESFKRLHRLIVTSSVYRQSSCFVEENAEQDGSNRWLWRMSRRRLDAESIRDSILAVSGALDPRMGGPGFYLFELERTEHSPHYQYHKFDPADSSTHRRSIYRFVVRSQPDPWMTTLDCADSSISTPKRTETLTALQALSLLNSSFSLEMAERFAERLRSEAGTRPDQIDRAMALIVQRLPEESERRDLIAYAESHGLANLCRLLFNLNEFVFVD